MKITKEYLRRVIKEELERTLNEEYGNTLVGGQHLLSDLQNNGASQTAKMLMSVGVKPEGEYELVPTDGTKTQFNIYPKGQAEGWPLNGGKGFILAKDLKSVVIH